MRANQVPTCGFAPCVGVRAKELVNYMMNTAQFINRARAVHGDKYDYSKTNYTGIFNKVVIICSNHGEFEQVPNGHVNARRGCKRCGVDRQVGLRTDSKEKFIEKAVNIHGDRYDYSRVEYKTARKPVEIICKLHGSFNQTPDNHLRGGKGCMTCGWDKIASERRKSVNQIIEDMRQVHGEKYDYSKVIEYKNGKVKVPILCSKHGVFWQAPSHHLHGEGCPKCKFPGFSHIANSWLDWRQVRDGVKIQSIMSEDGEFRVCGKPVDGYSEETNTVYEFHGDMWHGNPSHHVFGNPDGINPISKKSYGELYEKTKTKKNEIIATGYNYVEIWETDWRHALSAVRTIQKIWRQSHKKTLENKN